MNSVVAKIAMKVSVRIRMTQWRRMKVIKLTKKYNAQDSMYSMPSQGSAGGIATSVPIRMTRLATQLDAT